jgi:hypothetical protein
MADFTESSTWGPVHELGVTERAKGGPGGALNAPLQDLVDRDKYLKTKLEDLSFNVKAYGAVGDDSTDDTAAIQAAIDAAFTAGGGEVFIPTGRYVYSRLILKEKVSLIGVGRSISVLRCTNLAAGSSIARANDNSSCFFVRIENLTICTATSNVTAAQDTSQTLIGLNLAGVAYAHIQNISVQGFGGGGIVLARAELGAEGLGFTACEQDGNYNTIINAQLGGNGKYNADNAALWFKYKANSNKLMGLYFKGAGAVNAIVIAYGNDNSIMGGTFESLARGVWFKAQTSNNFVTQMRAEGLVDSVSPAVTTAIIKADSGSSGNTVIGIHQSSAATFIDKPADAYLRVFAGPFNALRSGVLSITNLSTTSDHHFTDTLGFLTDPTTGLLYVKSPGYGDGTPAPLVQLRNTVVATTAGMTLAEWQAFNNDSSTYTYNGVAGTGYKGANACIRAKAFDAAGRSGFSFLTGTGNKPNEVLELDQHVKVTGGSWDVSHLMLGQNHLWVEGAASWAPTRYYSVGDQRRNGTNLYVVASVSPGPTTGLSAVSGGPTGTGTGIVDGEVTWNYVSAAAPSRLRWKATAPTSDTDGALIKPYFDVKDYGAVGDGTTDDTVAIRAAVAAAEAIAGGAIVDFSGPPVAWVCKMVTITGGDLVLRGGGARVIQRLDTSCVQIGGGDYTVSAVFLCQRGSQRIRIEGFRFEQHAEFDSIAAGYTATSNFSPIVVHRAHHVTVRDCVFDCRMGRGIQWRGGNYGRLLDCTFLGCGFTAAHGNVTDAYYGDVSSDTSTIFSPIGFTAANITVIGTSANSVGAGQAAAHLTSCDKWSLSNVKCLALNTAGPGFRIYVGDAGLTDVTGASVTVMQGTVDGCQVYGTVSRAYEIIMDTAVSGSDVDAAIVLNNPMADVTGVGIYAERFVSGKILGAQIRSSSSPLAVHDSWENAEVSGRFVCTTGGLSNRTISIGSTAELKGVWWHDMLIEMPAADQYAIDTSGVASDFEAARLERIRFIVKTTTASARVVQIGGAKTRLVFSDNEFDIQASGMNNRFLMSLAGSTCRYQMSRNRAYTTNATSFQSRGVSVNSGVDFEAEGNDFGGMDITATGDVRIAGGRIVHGVSAVQPLVVASAARVRVSGLHIEQTASTNTVVADFSACASVKIDHASIKANNTNQPVIRAQTSGVLEVDAVDVSNAGSGVPYGVTGTALIGGNLGAYQKDATQWTDANRLSAAIFRPGTVFWNSSDNAPNYSDGSGWRDAVGVAT